MNFITLHACGIPCHAGCIASIGTCISRSHISNF